MVTRRYALADHTCKHNLSQWLLCVSFRIAVFDKLWLGIAQPAIHFVGMANLTMTCIFIQT